MRVTTCSHTIAAGWTQLLDATDDSTGKTLILCFAAPSYQTRVGTLRELRSMFPRAALLGCSTSGEILGTRVNDESLSVAVVRFDATEVRSAWARLEAGDGKNGSFAAGERLATTLAGPGLRGILVLSDGLAVNGSELVRGINRVVRDDVVVTGGLAGDGARFGETWVLDENGMPASGVVSAVGFYGDHVRVGHGSKGGWDAFGPERSITRAKGNVLYELDGKPALDLYKTYLGDRAAGLPATGLLFPLAVRSAHTDHRLVRTILSVDEATKSMTFAGDIEEGAHAQLMRANFDRLVQGASDAALMAGEGHGPVLSVAISCVGRRLVLGERIEEEVEATLECLPKGSHQVGYYSYGEISPYVESGPCDLHNQTMTLTTLSER